MRSATAWWRVVWRVAGIELGRLGGVRELDAERDAEQRHPRPEVRCDGADDAAERDPDLVGGRVEGHAHRGAQPASKGEVGGRQAVTTGLEHEGPEPVVERGHRRHQLRLADAGLPDHLDDAALATVGTREGVADLGDLVVPADQGHGHVGGGVMPTSRRAHDLSVDRRRLALDDERCERLELEVGATPLEEVVGGDHRAPRRVAHHPGGQVDRVAHHRERAPLRAPQVDGEDPTSVQTRPHVEAQ